MKRDPDKTTFATAFLPVGFLLGILLYGLVVRPLWLDQPRLPLEAIFLLASAFALTQLRILGHRWREIQSSIIDRLSRGMPGFFVLFAIGMLIGSWIACGTIPMLVHWGVRVLDPQWFYLLAFLVPVLFSSVTGTSWGSAGTIGVVIIGIALSIDADLGVTAGAIIGGAYFGDKMSPLSDTTNMAALGAEVELFAHIRSMMWTTIPAATIAAIIYTIVGLLWTPTGTTTTADSTAFLAGIDRIFTFHPALLLPPAVVLIGSIRRLPTIPVLGAAILVASVLALWIQPFELSSVCAALTTGFSTSMSPTAGDLPPAVVDLVERGGLYSMQEAIFVAFLVFFFIGILDRIDAMPIVVNRIFKLARGQRGSVLAALASSAMTNALTSNQYATSFIVGDAFKRRFDSLGIPRRVLSRSIEDTGTMIESLIPWHPTALFMATTLGVAIEDYWRWQILTLANLAIAPLLAITGIGCWYQQRSASDHDQA